MASTTLAPIPVLPAVPRYVPIPQLLEVGVVRRTTRWRGTELPVRILVETKLGLESIALKVDEARTPPLKYATSTIVVPTGLVPTIVVNADGERLVRVGERVLPPSRVIDFLRAAHKIPSGRAVDAAAWVQHRGRP
jgi:hypothetical protein